MKNLTIALALLLLSGSVFATPADVAALDAKVALKVEQITDAGLIPTSIEIEVITGDIVYNEVETTEITVTQAVEKYQIVPEIARYVEIKAAAGIYVPNTSNGIHPAG